MKRKHITIVKTPLCECIAEKRKAEEDIVAYKTMIETTPGNDDIIGLLIDDRSSIKSRMDDYIRYMEEAGREYIYTRTDGEFIKYEIGDLLF